MENYIFDCQPHALNDKLAYILKKVSPFEEGFDIKNEKLELFRAYAEYLYAFEKKKVIEIMMRAFENATDFEWKTEGVSIIYYSPQATDILLQFGTLAMKFERAKKDTLVTP